MSISCNCDYDGDISWYYQWSYNFKPLATQRARKCCSCGTKIKPGEDCLPFPRWRHSVNDIEERIFGEDGGINLATWYMCEECGGLAMAVEELGACFSLGTNIKTDVREWREAQDKYKARLRTGTPA